MAVRGNWRDIPKRDPDFTSAGMSVLPRVVTSLDIDDDDDDDDMSPEAVAARAARAAEQPQIAAEAAGADGDLQFDMELNNTGGKKRTKTRAVRRKRSYKKSKKSYKKSKKSYKKSKRCVATRKTHPEH